MDSPNMEKIGTFCGFNSPPPIVINKEYRRNIDGVVVLYFQSDSSANGRGFNVTYFYSSTCKYMSVITRGFVSYTVLAIKS